MLPQRNSSAVAGDVPFLQWSNGKSERRATPGRGLFSGFCGFYTEAGKHQELDDAARAAGIDQIEIRHQGGEIKTHWSVGEQASVYPLTAGPVAASVTQGIKPGTWEAMAAAGVGVRWPRGTDQNGQPYKSVSAVRVLVPALCEHGYLEPLQLSIRGMLSDWLLKALLDHVRICELADTALGRALFPGELALPLEPGPEVTVGKAAQMVVVPFVSGHPKQASVDYLTGLLRPEPVYAAIERLWPAIVAWAQSYNAPAQPDGPMAADAGGEPQIAPEDMDQAIASCTTLEAVQALRQRSLDLRDQRAINAAEQIRLADLCESKADELMDAARFDKVPF